MGGSPGPGVWKDRSEAGQRLTESLTRLQLVRPIVFGLARGGVVVGREVAQRLLAPLSVFVARKIYAPGRPEDAIGALAPGAVFLNEPLIHKLRIGRRYVDLTIAEEQQEMERQRAAFRAADARQAAAGRTVILVDDGIASGATVVAAVDSLRKVAPSRILVAAPVCAPTALELLRQRGDEVVCMMCPADFSAVSRYYRDFAPVDDVQVLECLEPGPERS